MKVVKLGGHLISTGEGLNLKPYVDVFHKLASHHRFHIVVGGGEIARTYIGEGRRLGVDEGALDLIGIKASWLNARLLYEALRARGLNYTLPEPSIWEISKLISMGNLIVAGGLSIAQSTTAVAAIIAEISGADTLVYATNVEGIYTKDPRLHPDAKLLREVTIDRLKEIFLESRAVAGTYPLFDDISIRVIERAKLKVVVVNGRDPSNIEKAMYGEKVGTIILPD